MKKLLLILIALPMIGFGQDKSPCLDERYIELKKIDLDSMSIPFIEIYDDGTVEKRIVIE